MSNIELESTTKSFLINYKEIQRSKLSAQPDWKINSLIRDSIKSQNTYQENWDINGKIEWLIENDQNPFVIFAKELNKNIESNITTEINRIINAMTNGRFLDLIGIPNYSSKTESLMLIEKYVDALNEYQKAGNNS